MLERTILLLSKLLQLTVLAFEETGASFDCVGVDVDGSGSGFGFGFFWFLAELRITAATWFS